MSCPKNTNGMAMEDLAGWVLANSPTPEQFWESFRRNARAAAVSIGGVMLGAVVDDLTANNPHGMEVK